MGYCTLDYDEYHANIDYWRGQGIELPLWANEVYDEGGTPVCALDFYDDIFGEDLEESCLPEDYKTGEYGAIAVELVPAKNAKSAKKPYRGRRFTVTRGNQELYDLINRSENFCMLAPISYAGKNRTNVNARYMYALALEIDNIKQNGVSEMFYSWIRKNQRTPKPTYVVCSGSGLHLYFVFERPIPLYSSIFMKMSAVKKNLVPRYWNPVTTTMKERKDIQWESLNQPFRCVGGKTKKNSYAMAFQTGEKVTIEYLNKFLPTELQLDSVYKSKISREKAKELYPKWYQKVVVNGDTSKGHWTRHKPIYYNWIQKVYDNAEVGHRYNCLENLCSLAVQCEISPDQVESDCRELAKYLETLTIKENNHFSEYDILCALQTYHFPNDGTWRRRIDIITDKTGIKLEPNKRNGQKQAWHLEDNRDKKARMKARGQAFRNPEGRPEKRDIVQKWRAENPDRKKADCIRETGLSKPTVYKWW